jgi:hypothetical protein
MAPSGFQSVSTLMINTYRRLGHASEFCGAWSGLLFCLAAILNVDDTDLLIVARDRDMTLDEFFEQSQSVVMDWGLIVQATGGYLKDTKCFWYMILFSRGVAPAKTRVHERYITIDNNKIEHHQFPTRVTVWI